MLTEIVWLHEILVQRIKQKTIARERELYQWERFVGRMFRIGCLVLDIIMDIFVCPES